MKKILLALTLILASAMGALPAAAQETPIQVLDQSLESHFPDDLTFHLLVQSDAGNIVEASLHLQIGWEETELVVNSEPFTPAPKVELSAVWDTFAETAPPFTAITYHWEVVDSSGERLSTEPAHTEYTDATHDWQRLEDEHVIVFWHDRPTSFGKALFEASQEAYKHVAHITGITTERAIRVVIYNDQEDFCAFYAPRTCQDWIGGQTFSGITVQWGYYTDWFIYKVVPHELAHVFYTEIFRDTWVSIPTWFNEGIAVYNERHDHSQEMALVLDAAEDDELKSLPIMTRGAGVAHGDVHLWYAVAYSLVAYLAETYGEETLGELILTLADNVPFEEALVETTGLDMIELEIGWRAWLGYPVDSVSTPVPYPTMPPVTIVPPSGAGSRTTPSPTPPPPASPTPLAATAPTPTAEPEEPYPSRSCCPGLLAMPLASLLAWGLARRRARLTGPT